MWEIAQYFSEVGAAAVCHFFSPSVWSPRTVVATAAVAVIEPSGRESSCTKSIASLPVVNNDGLSTRRFFRYFCYQNVTGPRKEEVQFNDDICSTVYDVIVLYEA